MAFSTKIRPSVSALFAKKRLFSLQVICLNLNANADALAKVKLSSQYSVVIDKLSVYLNPNVAKFEEDLVNSLAEDKSNWDKMKLDPSMTHITERRIKIGVHNGWRFVGDPHIVHLSVDDPASSGASSLATRKKSKFKSSLKPRASETDTATTFVTHIYLKTR